MRRKHFFDIAMASAAVNIHMKLSVLKKFIVR
jgi:hypothetical protein